MQGPVPYFEGRLVIEDSLIAGPAEFVRRDALGSRWWAVGLRHGGTTVEPQGALFTAAAGRNANEVGPVHWWGPVETRGNEAPADTIGGR
jgi:hypothetical protein